MAVLLGCRESSRPPITNGTAPNPVDRDGDRVERDAGADRAELDGAVDGAIGAFGGFDPAEVYLSGTLAEGASGMEAVAALSAGNNFLVGFDDVGGHNARIHPEDGYVYLAGDHAVHKFVPDPNPWRDVTNSHWEDYPSNPVANDPVIDMPPCTTAVSEFFIRPDTGAYLHTCSGAQTDLLDSGGIKVATCDRVLSVGYGGTVLCDDAVFDTTATAHPIDSIRILIARAKSDGSFNVVLKDDETTYSLWNIVATSGEVTKRYAYPPLSGFHPINADVPGWIALDGQARMYRWGSMDAVSGVDVVARFDNSAGTVVYDESKVWTKMHASRLITGQ